ncbi:Protein Y32F6A.4, partial [Aphelenchoides avenae]
LYIGLGLNLLTAVVACYTSYVLGLCWVILLRRWPEYRSHCRKPYAELGYRAVGPKMKFIVSVCLNITQFGIAVVYLLLSSKNIHDFVQWASGTDFNDCYVILCVALGLLPITFLKSPADFWYANICFPGCQDAPIQSQDLPILSQDAPIQGQDAPIQSLDAPIHGNAPIHGQDTPIHGHDAPIQSQHAPAQSQDAPIQSQGAPMQSQHAPIQSQDALVQQAVVLAMVAAALSVILMCTGAIYDYQACSSQMQWAPLKVDNVLVALGTIFFSYGGHGSFPTVQ